MTWETPDGTRAGVDCGSAIDELYHYLDGELTDDRRRQISEHLDFCAPCADALGFEAELRQVIADRCKDRVPDALRERIAALIEAEGRQPAKSESSDGA
ncbi:MAG: mycothiol system anti-sigma-R factor [Acidimicrobiales bacterium]